MMVCVFWKASAWFQFALWAAIFLILALVLGALLATTPTASFLLLSTVATVALIALGAGASALWLRQVLRKHGLGFRFAAS